MCVCAYIMVNKYIPIYIYIYLFIYLFYTLSNGTMNNGPILQPIVSSKSYRQLTSQQAKLMEGPEPSLPSVGHQAWCSPTLDATHKSDEIESICVFFPDGLLLPQTLSLDLCSSWKLSKLDRFNEGDRTKLGLSRLSVPSIWASSAFDWPPLEQGAIELERSWRRWSAITLDCEKVWTSYRRS